MYLQFYKKTCTRSPLGNILIFHTGSGSTLFLPYVLALAIHLNGENKFDERSATRLAPAHACEATRCTYPCNRTINIFSIPFESRSARVIGKQVDEISPVELQHRGFSPTTRVPPPSPQLVTRRNVIEKQAEARIFRRIFTTRAILHFEKQPPTKATRTILFFTGAIFTEEERVMEERRASSSSSRYIYRSYKRGKRSGASQSRGSECVCCIVSLECWI